MKKILSLLIALMYLSATSADKSIIIDGKILNSKFYPGTVHEYKVYIPKQYDGTKPACLYLGLDGILYNATAVMDTLIANGEMPVTIGVFVKPGRIANDSTVIRYNRSNEFDRIDDTFARFIESELLPSAESQKLADGRIIKISKDPNDRAISGASSSGIASFNTTFLRPDLFSRIYTTCGTFVSMRGGHEYPALIRKYEPRPMRVFIHDGANDIWNALFGHWYEQNQLVASALEFAGYEYKAVWDDGNHSIKNGSRLFPDAMRYLWKDYPAPVKAGKSQNNMLQAILLDGENWTIYNGKMPKVTLKSATSPDGKLFTETEPYSDWLISYTIDTKGKKSNRQQYYWLHNTLHQYYDIIGMLYATDGNLFVATKMGIQVCDHSGRVRAILPYPTANNITAFAFEGNNIFVKDNKGQIFTRKINATAHPAGAPNITYKSQGEG